MLICPNRHANPKHYRYCGECGAPLAAITAARQENPRSASGQRRVEAQRPQYHSNSNLGQPQQFYRPPPPEARPGPNYAKPITIGVMALLGIVVIVIVAIGIHNSVTTATTTARGGSTDATSAIIRGSSDDWYAAVCRSGTFQDGGGNGQWLTNAVGRASCDSSVSMQNWIFIGQYSSDYLARNDSALFKRAGGSSAMIRDTDGYMLFLSPTDKTGATLQPLAKYGFAIS